MFLIVFSFLIYKYCQHKKRRKDPQNLPLNEVKIDSNGTKTGQNNAENQYQELEVNNNTEDHSGTYKDDFKSNSKEENEKLENENQSPGPTIEIFGMLNNNKTKKGHNNFRKSIETRSIIRKKFSVKKENRPVLLNNQAIKRHIFPNCCWCSAQWGALPCPGPYLDIHQNSFTTSPSLLFTNTRVNNTAQWEFQQPRIELN